MTDAASAENQKRRRVAITGIGCITPIGIGKEALWAGLHAGKSAVRLLDRFDPTPFRTHIGGQVDDFEAEDFIERSRLRRLDRYGRFAVAATRLALDDAALDTASVDPERVGVQLGTALGGIGYAEHQLAAYIGGGVRAVDPMLALTVFGGAASCSVAIEFSFSGPNSTNGMSCASGTMAIGEAWRFIREGSVDVAIAGGVEAPLAPLCYGAFAIIRAMSTRNDDPERACRPFDAGRDGFVMGEGAAVLVLEEWEHARSRGAHIYAELLGYGTTNDAHHMTAPRPDGAQAARAMRLALATAGIRPDQIDYVNAHGSSTSLNDRIESGVIREVLGPAADDVAVSATKAFHAHSLGASGAIEAAITALAIEHGWIPPTLNFEQAGEGCDLPMVRGAGADRHVRFAISNSFGFGGINAALVFANSTGAAGANGSGARNKSVTGPL
jgi:3-oxoacyl-[acyl-carrier-protein] synthase II